ncbi:MAG: hypothetical protein ACREOG_16075 [Gemmatimonadaceae bacterium]
MALALLTPSRVPGSPGTVAFRVDLGRNRFFQYSIGDETVDRDRGFPVLGAPSFTSPVLGPLPDAAFGRTMLEIPVARFDREHRSLQLTSYRNKDRHGPALSDIVRAPVTGRVPNELPPIAFSMRHDMDAYTIDTSPEPLAQAASWRPARAMAYREVRPVSSAMLLGSIIPVLSGLVSKVAPVVSGLLKGGGGKIIGELLGGLTKAGGGTAVAPSEPLIKPETAALLQQLLQQLAQPATPAQPAPVVGGGTATASSLVLSRKYVTASEYSHAAVAPALLAALPALMPLLEKVLTPETIKGILDTANPTKIIGAVTDSVKEIGKLGLDFDKQSNEHLRALNPMGVHAPVDDLLKGMGFAASLGHGVTSEKGEPAYRRVESVELNFAGASPVMIHGRSRVCYRAGEQVAFALDVKTPRAISDATLALLVKNPETRKILVRKSFPVAQIQNGRLPKRAELTASEIKELSTGEEYLVCAYLTWKNSKGKVIGTSRTQLITLVGEYTFDRVEEGSVVPLNDVSKYRAFWHKVWQGSFTKDFFKVDFEAKYYYVLEPKGDRNAPIETKLSFADEKERVRHGRLKSGMTTTLAALNDLIPQISTGKGLNEAQLSALRSSDFVARFNTAARTRAALSGKAGVSAALWVYPEVKLHQVVLFKAASTDADSHVRELTEERVHFPIPVTLHVIGARTTQ